MTLRNLILIADERLTMAVYSKINDKSYRYNFKTHLWDENTVIDTDKLITVGEFKKSSMYKNHKKDRLVTWTVLEKRNLEKLKDIDIECENGFILSINIEFERSSTTSPKGRRAQANGVRHYGPK